MKRLGHGEAAAAFRLLPSRRVSSVAFAKDDLGALARELDVLGRLVDKLPDSNSPIKGCSTGAISRVALPGETRPSALRSSQFAASVTEGAADAKSCASKDLIAQTDGASKKGPPNLGLDWAKQRSRPLISSRRKMESPSNSHDALMVWQPPGLKREEFFTQRASLPERQKDLRSILDASALPRKQAPMSAPASAPPNLCLAWTDERQLASVPPSQTLSKTVAHSHDCEELLIDGSINLAHSHQHAHQAKQRLWLQGLIRRSQCEREQIGAVSGVALKGCKDGASPAANVCVEPCIRSPIAEEGHFFSDSLHAVSVCGDEPEVPPDSNPIQPSISRRRGVGYSSSAKAQSSTPPSPTSCQRRRRAENRLRLLQLEMPLGEGSPSNQNWNRKRIRPSPSVLWDD